VHRATGDKSALELAQSGFRWLESHAHDAKHGGYFEALSRVGKPITASRGHKAWDSTEIKSDAIGTRYGFKSMNSHIHLLEAFSALYERWPDATLKRRLLELHQLVRDKITVPSVGAMHLYFLFDWTPVPDHDSYGHDVETAFLLAESAHALGMPNDVQTWSVARRLVDHALEAGWDAQNGGFYDAGGIYGPIFKDNKVWWVQAEGLNALLLMHEKFGPGAARRGDPKYFEAFQKQWSFISRHQIDPQSPGWFTYVSRDGSKIISEAKSNAWQEGYHQGRAMMHVADGLRRLARGQK
jgi:mannobiose 2-epimerase